MLIGSSWKNMIVFRTFYPKDTISRDKNSNNLEYNFDTSLLSNSSIVWIIFITSKKFRKNLWNLYGTLSIDLKLFNKEFQSFIFKLMHSIELHLSIALNILHRVYSSQESWEMKSKNNRIIAYEGYFGFNWVTNAKESKLSANPRPCQHKNW